MNIDKPVPDQQHFNAENIMTFMFRWRKQLIVVTLAAIIISGVTAWMIPSLYKSKVVMFPVSTISTSKTILKEWDDVLKIGEEKEAERMLQILQSNEIREKVAKKFDLYKHYGIDPNSKMAHYSLEGEYGSNISFNRTEFMSVQIEVLDRSPDTAAFIANYIASLLDSTVMRMQQERAMYALKIVENEYFKKRDYAQKLEDSLLFYTQKGIFDYEKQSKILYKEITRATAKNDIRTAQLLDEKMKTVVANGWKYGSLRDKAYYERNEMLKLKTKYEQTIADTQQFMPGKYIISNAYPAQQKTYPIRWLIVLVSTLSAVAAAIVFIMAFDNFFTIKSRN